jgi:hypothetical protein
MKFRKKLNKINKTEGQIIVESIIALAVITVGFLSLIALMSNAIGLSKVNSEYYIATYLAAEGIEVVKNIIDNNAIAQNPWNKGLTTNGTYEVEYNSLSLLPNQNRFLNFDPNSKIYSYSNGQPTRFKRVIEIKNINANHIKVKSTVSWVSRGGAQFQVDLEDHFYNSYSLASSPSSPSSPSPSPSPPSSTSSPPQTNIDILSYFLRKDLITYPGNSNYKYSPTEFKLLAHDFSKNITSTIEFNQFTDNNNGIFLEKWRDRGQRIYYTYDNNYIYMKYDSTGEYPYSFSDGKWLKRYMNVGETINVTINNLQYYNSTSSCAVSSTPQKLWSYNIKLADSTTDNLPDIGNVDVIIVEYHWGNAIEKEYYAKDYGIYRWEEFINGILQRDATLSSVSNTSSNPPPLPLNPCY